MKLQILSVSEGKKKEVPGFKVVNTFKKSLTFICPVGGRVLRWLRILLLLCVPCVTHALGAGERDPGM